MVTSPTAGAWDSPVLHENRRRELERILQTTLKRWRPYNPGFYESFGARLAAPENRSLQPRLAIMLLAKLREEDLRYRCDYALRSIPPELPANLEDHLRAEFLASAYDLREASVRDLGQFYANAAKRTYLQLEPVLRRWWIAVRLDNDPEIANRSRELQIDVLSHFLRITNDGVRELRSQTLAAERVPRAFEKMVTALNQTPVPAIFEAYDAVQAGDREAAENRLRDLGLPVYRIPELIRAWRAGGSESVAASCCMSGGCLDCPNNRRYRKIRFNTSEISDSP